MSVLLCDWNSRDGLRINWHERQALVRHIQRLGQEAIRSACNGQGLAGTLSQAQGSPGAACVAHDAACVYAAQKPAAFTTFAVAPRIQQVLSVLVPMPMAQLVCRANANAQLSGNFTHGLAGNECRQISRQAKPPVSRAAVPIWHAGITWAALGPCTPFTSVHIATHAFTSCSPPQALMI